MMRKLSLLTSGIALLQVAMIGCSRPAAPVPGAQPATPTSVQPATPTSVQPATPTAVQPGTTAPSTTSWWGEVDVVPALSPDSFWAPDKPKQMAPLRFGKLPREDPVYVTKPAIQSYELAAPLPTVPDQLSVYVVGAYSPAHADTIAAMIKLDMQDCDFVWQYSLVACSPTDTPAGAKAPINSRAEAEARAKATLGQLWLPDFRTESVDHPAGGDWWVIFTQMVGDVPLYTDKPLQARFNAAGQLNYVLGRRRPLMAVAPYPLRSPADAWERVKRGDGFALNVAPSPKDVAQFRVTTVEVAYVMTHTNTAKEIMQPYYLFRNQQRQTLFIPAVADEHVTWSKPER